MSSFKLITLEGIDRSGKSSVAARLAQLLAPAAMFRFPDRTTPVGNLLNRFLKKEIFLDGPTLQLLYSANRQEKASEIRETLAHAHVVCDRYCLSGAVYSAAKGVDYEWCRSTDQLMPAPDYIFFIDTSPGVALGRSEFGSEAHDQLVFQERVYGIYKDKLWAEGGIVIDGKQSVEEIAQEIAGVVKRDIELNGIKGSK